MKNKVTVVVFEDEVNYELPKNPKEFLKCFEDNINMIPDEYIDSSRIELEVETMYGDSANLNLTITYTRPETDEEKERRLEKENMNKARIRQIELETLRRLKEKYETDNNYNR